MLNQAYFHIEEAKQNLVHTFRLLWRFSPGEECLMFYGWTQKTSQELRMLSSVTLDCQVTKIVMNSGSQL